VHALKPLTPHRAVAGLLPWRRVQPGCGGSSCRDINVFDSFPVDKLSGGRGRAVITASSSMEYAFEGDQLAEDHSRRPSLFTSAVIEGLATGDADRDEDGWVSLNELYDYVFDRVHEQNPNQTPSLEVEMQGELYVARNPRRRIWSPNIPTDLRAATADANTVTIAQPTGDAGGKPAPPSTNTERVSELDRLRIWRWLPHNRRARYRLRLKKYVS
jgi:hypothetical protein